MFDEIYFCVIIKVCEIPYNIKFISLWQSAYFIVDILTTTINIEKTTGNEQVILKSSFFDASITYTWKVRVESSPIEC